MEKNASWLLTSTYIFSMTITDRERRETLVNKVKYIFMPPKELRVAY